MAHLANTHPFLMAAGSQVGISLPLPSQRRKTHSTMASSATMVQIVIPLDGRILQVIMVLTRGRLGTPSSPPREIKPEQIEGPGLFKVQRLRIVPYTSMASAAKPPASETARVYSPQPQGRPNRDSVAAHTVTSFTDPLLPSKRQGQASPTLAQVILLLISCIPPLRLLRYRLNPHNLECSTQIGIAKATAYNPRSASVNPVSSRKRRQSSTSSQSPRTPSPRTRLQAGRGSETAAYSPRSSLDVPNSHENHRTAARNTPQYHDSNAADRRTEERETRATITTATTDPSDSPFLSSLTDQTQPSPSSSCTGRGRSTPPYPILPSLTKPRLRY